MIITTTPSLEGKKITSYLGVVTGDRERGRRREGGMERGRSGSRQLQLAVVEYAIMGGRLSIATDLLPLIYCP